MRWLSARIFLSFVLVAGCSSVAQAPVAPTSQVAGDLATALPELMRGALGFDPPRADANPTDWEGWRQLFRVQLEDAGRSRTWWVLTRVAQDAVPSERFITFSMTIDGVQETIGRRLTRVSVWVQEQGEDDLHASVVELPRPARAPGAFDLCQVYLARSAGDSGDADATAALELTHAEKRMYMTCVSSFVELLRVIQGSEDLSHVLWSVIQKPNWVGVILKGGDVSVSIDPRFADAAAVMAELAPPLESLPACRFPMSVDVNEERALDCELTVCSPRPPLHLGGGIIRLVGTHPTRRERHVTIELLGSRGPAATAAAAATSH